MPNLGREKIQKLKEKSDIKKLSKVLSNKDSFICEQAIDAIAEIKDSDERRSCLINAL